jgi:monodechloroaminopyrrolnitrin synthase
MTIPEGIASIRDLGMMASSLARHGVKPTSIIPLLEERLLQLGKLVDMVPRDTVYHYGVWNPLGDRERRFTGAAPEAALINAVRVSAPAIDATLEWLCRVIALRLDSEEFVSGCREATQRLGAILGAIEQVKKEIPPEFFAQTLRPYFAPLELGKQVFNGASAAPLSMCILDHLLWSSDCRDRAFRQFQLEQIRYNMPHWRRLYAHTLGEPSLVTRLIKAHSAGELRNCESIAAVVDLLQVVIAFRGRHRFVAMRAYSVKIRQFEVGSGGYGVATLEHILELTREASKSLGELIPIRRGRRIDT